MQRRHFAMKSYEKPEKYCRNCTHFCNDPAYLETEMPGWSALGSAWGSTRVEDGICSLRGLYLSATQSCELFAVRDIANPDEHVRSATSR